MKTRQIATAGWSCVLVLFAFAGAASAQLAGQVPAQLAEVGVTERLGEGVPFDLDFVDDGGETVRFGDFFDGLKPVILTLNYYRCPMLCGLQLNGLTDGLRELEWTSGQEFELVTVSINPLETPRLAKLKKQAYIKEYGRPSAATGWHFLTGREGNIQSLAEALGFRYTFDPKSGEYAHSAAIFVITPGGRIARYLYGIEYPSSSLKLALLEASEGTIGSALDQLILYCFHYDPASRRYSPVAMNIMRLGGGATVAVLAMTLGVLWLREGRRRRSTRRGTSTT